MGTDEAGFAALWLRDAPYYDPSFGDVGQVFDPMVYAGYLAGVTSRIAIGTAGIIMPLRDPSTATGSRPVSVRSSCPTSGAATW